MPPRLSLFFCLMLGVGVFSWQLGSKHLWIDEAVSWDMATSPLPELIDKTITDVHPPLYYLLMKGWVLLLGDSVIALRALSALGGLMCIVMMFQLGRQLLPRFAVALAVVIFIVSPHTVYVSQEARMYPLVTAAVLAACVGYRSWISSYFVASSSLAGYVVAMIAALYLHYFAGFVIIALWVHLLVCRRRLAPEAKGSSIRDWIVAHMFIAAAWGPWLGSFLEQATRGQPWRQHVAIGQLPYQVRDFALSIIFGFTDVPDSKSFLAVIVMVIFAFAIVGLILAAVMKQAREGDIFLAAVTLIPIGIGLALLPLTGSLMLMKYLAYASPLLLLATARGLTTAKVPDAAVAVVLVGLAAIAASRLPAYYDQSDRDYDAKPIAEFMRDITLHAPAGTQDQVLVVPDYFEILLRYHTRRDIPYQPIRTPEDLTETLDMAASTTNRVWIIADYRWELLHGPIVDDRLLEVPVSASDPKWVKLFRVRPR